MTIYDIKNIDKCTVKEIGSPVIFYRVTANEGYYVKRNDEITVEVINEGTEEEERIESINYWKVTTMLRADEDAAILEIAAAATLTEDDAIEEGSN